MSEAHLISALSQTVLHMRNFPCQNTHLSSVKASVTSINYS